MFIFHNVGYQSGNNIKILFKILKMCKTLNLDGNSQARKMALLEVTYSLTFVFLILAHDSLGASYIPELLSLLLILH